MGQNHPHLGRGFPQHGACVEYIDAWLVCGALHVVAEKDSIAESKRFNATCWPHGQPVSAPVEDPSQSHCRQHGVLGNVGVTCETLARGAVQALAAATCIILLFLPSTPPSFFSSFYFFRTSNMPPHPSATVGLFQLIQTLIWPLLLEEPRIIRLRLLQICHESYFYGLTILPGAQSRWLH